MKGWFDAFRSDGGPTLYAYSNRTPVTGDVQMVAVCVVFFAIFLAFLLIFPGVRKERFTTFTSVTLSLFVGTVILVANYGCGWHVASTDIVSSYRAFSREKIGGHLGAYIGLGYVNVTLRAPSGSNRSEDIDFNERFRWSGAGEMQESQRAALERGLPFPILTVAEYLSADQEGFNWGRMYRSAGYYASITLWAAFASWIFMNILIAVVPRYGAYAMILTGGLMLGSVLVYTILLPDHPLHVPFEEGVLRFRLGWCFWAVVVAGALCIFVGVVIAAVDLVFPHRFSTILEVDYDTPYDRHIIIEESHHYQRNNKRRGGSAKSTSGGPPAANGGASLEEPAAAGLGSRILRRLSKREKQFQNVTGLDNGAFEMDPPKSPWRYPHLMHHQRFNFGKPVEQPLAQHRGLQRISGMAGPGAELNGKPNTRVVSFRRQSRPEPSIVPNFRRSDSQDSSTSSAASSEGWVSGKRHDSTGSSGASSLGLSFLDRGFRMVPSGESTTEPCPTVLPISNSSQPILNPLKIVR
ncbi:dual oxidase maturation factor 1-like isoform X2 [Hetaerina americana]|uniref:dual oxidase maturation factor 1-like isoform X2 n=1 Tax=Hetaerina americana TaxID=62018 RepID=UPI003A7F15BA